MDASVTVQDARTETVGTLAQSLKRATAAMRRLRGTDTHRPGAVSHAQYVVLFELLAGELAAGELAAVADVSPASMTQMLDRLANAGLVERTRSQTDRRIVVSHLTKAGRAACEERRAALEPLWHEMLADFSTSELDTATAVLDRLTEIFQHMGHHDEHL